MPNLQIATGNPLKLRFLLDEIPGWLHDFLSGEIGNSDQPGRAFFLGFIRRRADGTYLVEMTFRAVPDRPDSPALREFLEPLLALPKYEPRLSQEEAGKLALRKGELAQEVLELTNPPEQGTGTLIREKPIPVPKHERHTTLYSKRPGT